jgi:adenylate cyclase, class 2
MSASDSYIETEVKIRFDGRVEAARALIEQNGYQIIEPRTLESDQVFDREDTELKRADKLLRLRRTGSRAMITYKGPSRRERYKSREEIEFDVSNSDAMTEVLDRLGYLPCFRYEKYRTKFAAPGENGVVTIDETPIGIFLELEGAPDWIDRTAARLGLSPDQYLTSSYASLYREYRQKTPGTARDMTFD